MMRIRNISFFRFVRFGWKNKKKLDWLKCAHFGQSNFSFFQPKRKKEILLILIIFTYFKVQNKIEKKKMVRKIDHFSIFLILTLNSKIQKILLTAKKLFCFFFFSCYCWKSKKNKVISESWIIFFLFFRFSPKNRKTKKK